MGDKMKILFVDDDPIILKSAERALIPEGHTVEGALNGKEAMARIEQNNYDLVFTDLKMPGIDGISLIRWLRQFRPDIGIVVMTGYLLPETIKEAHKLGIIVHMMKPFTPEALKSITNETIEWIRENSLENEQKEDFHPSMLAELDNIIHQYRNVPSSAILVMLHVQEIFGYLSSALQKRIAKGLNLYPSEIHSIVSFYPCFRTKAKDDYVASHIRGSAGVIKGIIPKTGKRVTDAVKEYIKWKESESKGGAGMADIVQPGRKDKELKKAAAATESIKILVVDDDPIILKSADRVLNDEGYNVEGVLSGKKAIRRMQQIQYDLVLTDLRMSEIDGFSLIRWIKEFRPTTGIVVITGYPLQETIKEALKLGISDLIIKPFTPEKLKDVVNKAIEQTRGTTLEKIPKEEFSSLLFSELDKVIQQYRNVPGSATPVLLRAQEIFGYLPDQVQEKIAKGLNIYPSEIQSIVSLHSCFRTKPAGDNTIRVCLGATCYLRGSERVLRRIKDELNIGVGETTKDRKFTLEVVKCNGACGIAPRMYIEQPEDSELTEEKTISFNADYSLSKGFSLFHEGKNAAGQEA